MASCIKNIATDILFDCDNPPSQGLEARVVLINRSDIDRTLSVENVDGTQDVELQTGKTGYVLEGVKQINSYNATVTVADNQLTKVAHAFVGRIFNITAETRAFIASLISGANLVAVVEKKAKGAAGKYAYQILGWDNGLEISEGVENSAENDGAFGFTLASSPLALEPRMPLTFFDAIGGVSTAEVASLSLTGTVTTAGSVEIILDGVSTSVPVALNDTASAAATKIRNASYTGWTTGGIGTTVTFTSDTTGTKQDTTYSTGSSAGVTGVVTTTTQGTTGNINASKAKFDNAFVA